MNVKQRSSVSVFAIGNADHEHHSLIGNATKFEDYSIRYLNFNRIVGLALPIYAHRPPAKRVCPLVYGELRLVETPRRHDSVVQR